MSAADNQWYGLTYGDGLFFAVAHSGAGNRVMTSPDGITLTSRMSAADNRWRSVTYGNGLFVAVGIIGAGSRVMASGAVPNGGATTDPTQWITHRQALPMPESGSCADVKDADVAYGTGLTGGWTKAWEPWVNPALGADGQRFGGWPCCRTLINTGGSTWRLGNW